MPDDRNKNTIKHTNTRRIKNPPHVPIYEKPIDIDPIHFIKPVNQRRQRLVVAGSSSTQMAHCGRMESKAFSIRVLIYGCHCILAHSHAPTCIIAPLRNWNGIAKGKLSWCTKYNREWMARGNWLHMLSQLILPFVRSFVRQQEQSSTISQSVNQIPVLVAANQYSRIIFCITASRNRYRHPSSGGGSDEWWNPYPSASRIAIHPINGTRCFNAIRHFMQISKCCSIIMQKQQTDAMKRREVPNHISIIPCHP